MYNLTAITTEGAVYDHEDVETFVNLPLDQLCYVQVDTEDTRYPTVRFGCDPGKGERLRAFLSRRGDMLVLEIRSGDRVSCRLYLHPALGPILTTEDLEL